MRRTTTIDNDSASASGSVTPLYGGILDGAGGLIEDSRITGNHSSGIDAGGLLSTGLPGDKLTVSRTTIDGNDGGGIGADVSFVLENSTVSGNGAGWGLDANYGGDTTIRSSTIADQGGIGLRVSDNSSPATIDVRNSILDANSPNCQEDGAGSITSSGGNVESADDCGFGATGDQPLKDPLLGALVSNGGPTPTRAIPATSPAIDAAAACPPPSTDQRGIARPHGAACDSGAYERVPPPPSSPGGGGSAAKAPALELDAKRKQKAKKLKVKVGCGDTACVVELGGAGKVPKRAGSSPAAAARSKKFKLAGASIDVAAGKTETARLKFKRNGKTVRKIVALIKRGGKKAKKRSKVIVSASASAAGGTDTAETKVKLKG